MTTARGTRVAALAIACSLFAGCGGAATKQRTAAPQATVVIRDFKYRPATLRVAAGTRVAWRNEDASPHTATARGGGFRTGVLERGQSRTLTLTHAGRFSYVCVLHPFMHGTVIVAAR